MEENKKTVYKRLPGRGPRKRWLALVGSKCTLHLAKDHILSVENSGFSETYKRFYFSDIQAIITRHSSRMEVTSVIAGILAALFLIGLVSADSIPGKVTYGFFLIISIIVLVINLSKGPACVCTILTAVQEEELPSMGRARMARKVIDILKRFISEAQGGLTHDEFITRRRDEEPPPVEKPFTNNLRRPENAADANLRHYSGTMHMVAFAIMTVDGILFWFRHGKVLVVASGILEIIYMIFLIIALVRQVRSDVPGDLKNLTWAALGVVFLYSIISLSFSPQSSTIFMTIYWIIAACLIVFGIAGIVFVINHRKASLNRVVQSESETAQRAGAGE